MADTRKDIFIVDLRGMQLSPEQSKRINEAIQATVQKEIAEIDDLESANLDLRGPMLLGLVIDQER